MKVQLLSFPGCPNADAARGVLKRSLASLRLSQAIEEVDVTAADTPEHLREWGSPTILINDVDVGGESGPSGSSCRLYEAGGDPYLRGAPPESLVLAALERARRES
jgi:hypothetical protein